MTDDLEHVECAELLGAFALHGVDGPEALRVEHHVERCLRCRQELDELRAVAADLGTIVDTCPPPLWERIADRLEAEPGGTREAAPVPVSGDQGLAASARVPGAHRTVTDAAPGRRRTLAHRIGKGSRRSRTVAVAGLGATVVVAALGISLVAVGGQLAALRSEMSTRGSGIAVQSALAAPGHSSVALRSGSGATLADLVVRPGGAGYVVSVTAPALPGDETYQLWAYIAGQPISLGLLGQQISEGAPFSLGSGAHGATRLMITVEPSGGVVMPDKAPVAAGTLTMG